MNINLYINKQSARADVPEIYSGSVGVLTVTLFGELDSSLIPVLRFMHESGEGYYTAKIENGCALVPHEVIHAPGFSIAVAGYENDGEEVKRFLPSEAVYISVKENGYGNPDDAVSEEEESRSLIGQILSECQSVKGEVTAAKAELSKELSDAKDEMSDSILFTKEELERKYSSIKNYLDDTAEELFSEEEVREKADGELSSALNAETKARADADSALEELIEKEKKALGVKLEDVADALLSEEYKRAEEDEKLCALLDDKVDKEDGVGLSAVYDISFLESPDNADNWYTVIEVLKQRGDSELKLYSKEQTDEKLAKKVSKEDGYGLSATRYVSELRFYDTVTNTDTFGGIGYETQNGEYYEIYLYNQEQMDEKLSEKAATSAVEALYNETMEIKYDMFLKQDVTEITYMVDEPDYAFFFAYTDNTDTRLTDDYTTSISFTFANNVYQDGYISSLSFYSGETPTRIDYTDSGILNWVGTDCSDNNGYSIFKPEANKHYDIVFYFNGRQFIGLVNGFVPSLGNVVS